MTPGRFAVVDFAGGYTYTSVAILIPMPKLLDNSYAVAKPFQVSVKRTLDNYFDEILTQMLKTGLDRVIISNAHYGCSDLLFLSPV